MKYGVMFKAFGFFLNRFSLDQLSKQQVKQVAEKYKEIVLNAKDIGQSNNLVSSYALGCYFIALNRVSGLSPDECYEIIAHGMKTSKAFKTFMGSADAYFSEKKMEHRRKWAAQTHKHQYENDWVVDVLEKSDDYEFGFNYHECGVCKLFKDEGCFELAKYLCRLDFLIVEIMGIHLERTMTIADGDPYCDFRFKK